jgi:adenosylmethionine-8-amino-7-oxononanoate aminotransferase
MSHVFPRHTKADLPVISTGSGVYLIDENGKRYIDGSCGAATSCLGHNNAKVIAAIKSQLDAVAYAHTGFFTSNSAEKLADKLIAHAPEGIEKVYLVSGGSEAVEAALKLARQYFIEKGEASRQHIIARKQSYHGNTLGALATGGNEARRKAFAPLLIETTHISPCYEYRNRQGNESVYDYGQRVANELETEIKRLGAENVMAFVAEPVVGATAGVLSPVEGYFTRIREICDNHGVLLILDEVMCGMGRTGTLFACEQDGIAPDIVTIAKGLGAGYQPIGAMLCTNEIYQTIADGSGFFHHGHTYMGHPTACAASLSVLEQLVDDDLVGQSQRMGVLFHQALVEAFGDHPHVGDIRGRGLFWGLELVADRVTKQPFPAEKKAHQKIKAAAFEAGLICYPGGGTIDGKIGDHILLAPPFIINEDHIKEIITKLSIALKQVL